MRNINMDLMYNNIDRHPNIIIDDFHLRETYYDMTPNIIEFIKIVFLSMNEVI